MDEEITAGAGARLELSYVADDVYLVLGGTGTVTVRVGDGTPTTIQVSGVPKLYTIAHESGGSRRVMTLDVDSGVQAYDFTFG